MAIITVVCREESYEDILIYTVHVRDPNDHEEVKAAVQAERNNDLEDEANEVEIFFAFPGDIATCSDWRS